MLNDIRSLIEGTASKATTKIWSDDFNAGVELDPDELRPWVLSQFEQVVALASPDAPAARRHAAVFALGCSRDPRAVRPLLDVLVAERHRYDHDFVAMAFRRFGPEVVPTLVAELPSRNALRTQAALVSMGQIDDVPLDVWREIGPAHADYPELYISLFNQHRAELVSVARLGLGRPAVHIDALLALAECAEIALKEGSDALAREVGLADQVAAGLDPLGHRADKDPDASLWGFTVQILAALRDPRAFDAAARALDDGSASEDACHTAVKALGQLGDAAATSRLRTVLHGKDPLLQVLAAEALGMDDAEAKQAVLSLAAELRVDRPGWWDAISLIAELPDGTEQLASWIDPAKPRARRSRSAICGLANLAMFDPTILDSLRPEIRPLVEARSHWE